MGTANDQHPPILLAGATGLVGGLLLARLLAANGLRQTRVIAIGRRTPPQAHPRLQALSLDEADRAMAAASPSHFVCCLGSTLRQAGSQAAFAAVDRDLVLRLAALARDVGARHALMVSSVGADAASGNFYLRTKGEAEDGLAALGFARCDFARPGLLLGPRGSDRRPGERLAQRLAPLSDRLLHGRLRRYRAIPAEVVAAALAALLDQRADGIHIHHNDALQALAAGR